MARDFASVVHAQEQFVLHQGAIDHRHAFLQLFVQPDLDPHAKEDGTYKEQKVRPALVANCGMIFFTCVEYEPGDATAKKFNILKSRKEQ